MSSLRVNHAPVNTVLALLLACCSPGRWSPLLQNSQGQHLKWCTCKLSWLLWSGPKLQRWNGTGTNPFPQNKLSCDRYALLLFPDLMTHEHCSTTTKVQLPSEIPFLCSKVPRLFLLQVRLIPGCRNTYFLPPYFPQGNRSCTMHTLGAELHPSRPQIFLQ